MRKTYVGVLHNVYHLCQKKIKSRLAFSRQHLKKPMAFWKNILWTDESKFFRFGSDGKQYVLRPPNLEPSSKVPP